MAETVNKARKMKPLTRRWYKLADELAREYAPMIYPCAKCGYPVASGYCCVGCGTGDPRSAK